MENFAYVAYSKEGREIKGTIEADSLESAKSMLRGQGSTVISVERATAMNSEVNLKGFQKKPSARDMSVFCRQFVAIVDAGVPVLNALQMLSEQTENQMLREAIADCKGRIEKGSSMAAAMREHPKVFDHIFVTMVEAGESSGSLSQSFSRMGKQYEKSHRLHSLVKKATIYPVVLLIVTAIVVVFLLVRVVPMFQDMMDQVGADLPAITKFVLGLSHGLQQYWYIVLAVVVAVVLGIRQFNKGESGGHIAAKIQVKLPVVKNLTIKSNSASFARTLATLLAAGIPMMDALGIVANTLKNVLFRDAVNEAKTAVSMGSNLSNPLKANGQFPPLVYHMISIGEDTGQIDEMLDRIADYYDEEVEEATEQVVALMEPLIIVVLAVVVGTIVISVVAPMGSLYESLDQL